LNVRRKKAAMKKDAAMTGGALFFCAQAAGDRVARVSALHA
jgi:hypothetical protein